MYILTLKTESQPVLLGDTIFKWQS